MNLIIEDRNKVVCHCFDFIFICGTETGSMFVSPEAVVRRCSVKKRFLEISQNLQENTCAWVSEVFSCEFCEISKNTFS